MLTLASVRTAFEAAGLEVVEGDPIMTDLIRANQGRMFIINGGLHPYLRSIEVLVFATDITSGREARDQLRRDGFGGRRAIVRHNLAIFEHPDHPDWNRIRAAFEAL